MTCCLVSHLPVRSGSPSRVPAVIAVALLLSLIAPGSAASAQDKRAFPLRAKRVVFLGDSITHAGGYIVYLEAELIARNIRPRPELINLGLPSETCSGLSEPIHPFPRPDVHERLDRALQKSKPDVVVACYGMNDGIYYPFGKDRFAKYMSGIRRLEEKVHKSGAKLVLMTPTVFDPPPTKENKNLQPAGRQEYSWKQPYKDYDQVLDRYGRWIVTKQKDRAEMVVDLRSPLVAALKARRAKDPMFVMADDGVHINDEGHRMVARAIANAWGLNGKLTASPELVAEVRKKQAVLHNAWLSHVGHKRPGMKPGLPLTEAEARAAEIDQRIREQARRQ